MLFYLDNNICVILSTIILTICLIFNFPMFKINKNQLVISNKIKLIVPLISSLETIIELLKTKLEIKIKNKDYDVS